MIVRLSLKNALRFFLRLSFFGFISVLSVSSFLENSRLVVIIYGGLIFSSSFFFLVSTYKPISKVTSRSAPNFLHVSIFFCLQAIILVSLLRTPWISDYIDQVAAGNIVFVIAVFGSFSLYFLAEEIPDERIKSLKAIVAGSAIFPLILLLFDLGMGLTESHISQFMMGQRVVEASLLRGPNTIAFSAALGLLCSLILARNGGSRLWYIISLVPIFYMIITASQGMTLILIICMIILFIPRILSRGLAYTLLFLWVFSTPILLILYTSTEYSFLGEFLIRAEAQHLGVGTGRTFIWKAAIDVLTVDVSQSIFGLGYMSAVSTPIRTVLEQVTFVGDPRDMLSRTYSLHNGALQYFFETGIIGLTIVSTAWLTTLRHNFNSGSSIGRSMNVLVVFILLSGFNEAAGTIYSNSFFPMMGIIAYCLLDYKSLNQTEIATQSYRRFRPVVTR